MGMQLELCLQKRALHLLAALRQQLIQPELCARHRRRPQDFSRECVLTFSVLMLFLLQKSLKSLQSRLHEFFWQWAGAAPVPGATPGALTHARAKLLPGAFVELNQRAVLATVYGPEHGAWARRWRGHRLLGIDSSVLRLPDSAALREHFGVVSCRNQHGNNESYPEARGSVLYDLLNEVTLDARLAPSRRAETEMAREHLPHLQPGDVIVTDRGYRGWGWFAAVVQSGGHFVCRCPRGSFAAAQKLFARNEAGVSVITTLLAPKPTRAGARTQGWPLDLRVRFVTVRLCTGELEVLATSLLDETAYPAEALGEVYGWRWGQETYYARLKGRLDLEHASGQSVAAVEQDFHALILLSNIESVVIGPAQARLAADAVASGRKQPAQVNRAVSLHALKSRLIELLASEVPLEQVLAELTGWFVHNPVSVRRGRKVPRRKFSPARSYHYQRRVRKIVF
jgi:hypothetical protein